MFYRVLFVILVSLLMVSNAFAEIKRVAVLEFRGVGVDNVVLLKLSDQTRLAALEVLDSSTYELMTRENMMQILSDMGKDASCLEGICEVDVGRNIGADFIVTGDLYYTEGVYYLTLKLYETSRGVLLAGKDIEAKSFGDLKSQTTTQALSIFQDGVSKSDGESAAIRQTDNPVVVKNRDYRMRLIPAGTFTMGCTRDVQRCQPDELPSHSVSISQDFYMMESEVTQGLFSLVMGYNPSLFKDYNLPVNKVTFTDAARFANELSVMEGLDQCYTLRVNKVVWIDSSCNGWRLPTEAEWEYAARGGQFDHKYAGSDFAQDIARFNRLKSVYACTKQTNDFELCDMSGNVKEWVWDEYSSDYYAQSSIVDPKGPQEGTGNIARGGSYASLPWGLRVSERQKYPNDFKARDVGFRLVRNL